MSDDIFRALSDPTRRSIFDKLALNAMNATELRSGMAISQPAVSQHLSVLRNAGLVREEKKGRFVYYEVDPRGIAILTRWFARYEAYWPRRIDDLKKVLKEIDQ